jgi:chitinase
MKKIICIILIMFAMNTMPITAHVIAKDTLRVLVLAERGGQHAEFTAEGLQWINALGKKMHFEMTEINDTKCINDKYLSHFSLIIQLNYPPYMWTQEAKNAFTDYIDNGRGGWIGFHHASLLGEFDGYDMWQWFSDFMGGIRYKNYIAQLADGTIQVEDRHHPVMKGLKAAFRIPKDEWYTYDKSPRSKVHVLAHVDESSYSVSTDIKMGDHPVIWSNESKKARNVYFQIGHSKELFDTPAFTKMFTNAIRWILKKK